MTKYDEVKAYALGRDQGLAGLEQKNQYKEADEWNEYGYCHAAFNRGYNTGRQEYLTANVDPSYNVELSPENQKIADRIGKHLEFGYRESNMEFEERKVGYPVYVKNHQNGDGTSWSGWAILKRLPDVADKFTVTTIFGDIRVNDIYLEKPTRETKCELMNDDDGNEIQISYGEYEGEDGSDLIFAIDTPFETVSINLSEDKVDELIKAIRKVRA